MSDDNDATADRSTTPKPLMWPEQRRLLSALPEHLAEMALFDLNTGARDEVVCNLQWAWEVPISELGISIFVVPQEFVKGVVGKKRIKFSSVTPSLNL